MLPSMQYTYGSKGVQYLLAVRAQQGASDGRLLKACQGRPNYGSEDRQRV